MNLSKTILGLTGLVARAIQADEFDPSFRMVQWYGFFEWDDDFFTDLHLRVLLVAITSSPVAVHGSCRLLGSTSVVDLLSAQGP